MSREAITRPRDTWVAPDCARRAHEIDLNRRRWRSARRGASMRRRSVAEDRPCLVPQPLPHRRRSGQAGVCDEGVFVNLSRLHAYWAHQQFAAALRELLEEPRERRTAITRDELGMTRQREAYGFLSQEHRDVAPALQRSPRDEKRNGHALAILEARRQVDQHLLSHKSPSPCLSDPLLEREHHDLVVAAQARNRGTGPRSRSSDRTRGSLRLAGAAAGR